MKEINWQLRGAINEDDHDNDDDDVDEYDEEEEEEGDDENILTRCSYKQKEKHSNIPSARMFLTRQSNLSMKCDRWGFWLSEECRERVNTKTR